MVEIQNTKMSKVVPWLICALGAALLVFAAIMFVSQLSDYSKSTELYETTKDKYVVSRTDEKLAVTTTDEKQIVSIIPEDEVEDKSGWEYLVDVDIPKLREINEDITGWIYFENVDISYPVLYSGDNDKYLRAAYTGEHLSAGSIFIDGSNSKDFSDAHSIIYGHEMKDLSMFGKLKYYVTKKDYLAEHEYFQIITESGKYRYRIVSAKIVADGSDIYAVYQNGGKDFVNFAEANISDGSVIEPDDHIITLSTCYKDDRLVVSAIRCKQNILN